MGGLCLSRRAPRGAAGRHGRPVSLAEPSNGHAWNTRRTPDMCRAVKCFLWLAALTLLPVRGVRPRHPDRYRSRCVRCRATRRDGRGCEPGPDRESPVGRDRRHRPVPHHRTESRRVFADVHASRFQHRQARWHRARWHRRPDDPDRDASGRARGNDHCDRRDAVVDVQSTSAKPCSARTSFPRSRPHARSARCSTPPPG